MPPATQGRWLLVWERCHPVWTAPGALVRLYHRRSGGGAERTWRGVARGRRVLGVAGWGAFQRAVRIDAALLAEEIADLVWVRPNDVQHAWETFRRYEDKGWSFTDCVSRVVTQRLGIEQAFAFDEHFRQFGIVTVVP